MKKIDTTQIVDPVVKQPFTGRSLKFLQDSSSEARAALIKSIILTNVGTYSAAIPYVISGVVITGAGANITAGEIFFNNEFFETTAIAGAVNIPVQFVLTKTQDAIADPVEFTDNSFKNVHDIYKYVATDTAVPQAFEATDFIYAFDERNPVVGLHSSVVPSITNTETTIVPDTVLSATKSGKAVISISGQFEPLNGGGGTFYTCEFKIKINGLVVCQKQHTFENNGAFWILEMTHYMSNYVAGDVIKITAKNSVVATVDVGDFDFIAEGKNLI